MCGNIRSLNAHPFRININDERAIRRATIFEMILFCKSKNISLRHFNREIFEMNVFSQISTILNILFRHLCVLKIYSVYLVMGSNVLVILSKWTYMLDATTTVMLR